MRLIVAHQILIGAATVLAFGFAARGAVLASRGQGIENAWMAAGSAVVAIVLAAYFRKVRAKARAEKP